MTYGLTRTSMALDANTLSSLDWLAKQWGVSKAAVIRRAVSQARASAEVEKQRPKPLEALEWLQSGGGLLKEEADAFRAEVQAEREAKKYWWEA
jgi:predicted transcriptional regulator